MLMVPGDRILGKRGSEPGARTRLADDLSIPASRDNYLSVLASHIGHTGRERALAQIT